MVKLYDKVLSCSRHKYAPHYLAIISFIEASVFPIPPYFMLAPMTLANPKRAIDYALIATVASVLGGSFGYFLGYLILNPVILPLIDYFGYNDLYQHVITMLNQYGFFALLLLSVTPVPYKLIAISSGALSVSLPLFVITSIISRGMKFFLIALLVKVGGNKFEQYLRVIISKIGMFLLCALSIGIIVYKVI